MREQLRESEKRHQKLEEENTSLKLELESRPSIKEWRKAQRMIELLKGKLYEAEGRRDEWRGALDHGRGVVTSLTNFQQDLCPNLSRKLRHCLSSISRKVSGT